MSTNKTERGQCGACGQTFTFQEPKPGASFEIICPGCGAKCSPTVARVLLERSQAADAERSRLAEAALQHRAPSQSTPQTHPAAQSEVPAGRNVEPPDLSGGAVLCIIIAVMMLFGVFGKCMESVNYGSSGGGPGATIAILLTALASLGLFVLACLIQAVKVLNATWRLLAEIRDRKGNV